MLPNTELGFGLDRKKLTSEWCNQFYRDVCNAQAANQEAFAESALSKLDALDFKKLSMAVEMALYKC